MLVMLDPITIDKVHMLDHTLHKAGALMIESNTKYKMMETDGFIVKVKRPPGLAYSPM
jgi:hypothetical protein